MERGGRPGGAVGLACGRSLARLAGGRGGAGPGRWAGGRCGGRRGQSVGSMSTRGSLSAQLVFLTCWYVLSVSEEAKSSQRREGLCQEQEELGRWAWESGPGTGRGGGSGTVREGLTVSSPRLQGVDGALAPFQHSPDPQPLSDPRPSLRSCFLSPPVLPAAARMFLL